MHSQQPTTSAGQTANCEVPTKDYARQYARLLPSLLEELEQTFLNDKPVLGRAVATFEENFSRWLGIAHCVGLNSGTDALILGLRALHIGPGDEVITQANTFLATVSAIHLVGATPVLVDCVADGPEINIDALTAVVTPRTRAVLVVHMHGFATPMLELESFCKARGLHLLEDAAQAHGAVDETGRRIGTIGTWGAFSFHPSKNLGAFGDAGGLVCHDADLAASVSTLRNLGKSGKHDMHVIGQNSKLDTLQAVILNHRLPHLEEGNLWRRHLASLYRHGLDGCANLALPTPKPGTDPVWHHYAVQHPDRDALLDFLNQRGIRSSLHYPVPPHLQPAFVELGYARGDFPFTERRAEHGLSLPMAAELTCNEIDRVVQSVQEFCAGISA